MADQIPSPPQRRIPLWVALAGMVVALMIAFVIMANVLEPLVNLVFPDEAKAPLPDGSIELEHREDTRLSNDEWLYGIDMPGCDVVRYYIDQGATCRIAPLACSDTRNEDDVTATGSGVYGIATCEGKHEAVVASYSWMVDISSGYDDYETKFRLYLFKERR